ncbi:MAG: hypothetical protein Hyperionvirus1_182 [Hyperionvirus sp.]|uniref:Uncharacterized protein n=1 Tax=Hyperionvirus sp. TaxID=2487770 RepID=A0A3G5A9U2_9VIRU|nr:MAG: hypothetical protein Hyperionvirus1_182 [Hyperionvirus sp.]
MRIKRNWKIGNYAVIKLPGHTESINALSCNPHFIVSASKDKTIRVWHILSRSCLHVFRGHTGSVNTIHVDDTEIVSGSEDGTIRIWSIDTGNEKRCIPATDHTAGGIIFKLMCTPNRIICNGSPGQVLIWDRETGNLVKILLIPLALPISSIHAVDNNLAIAVANTIFLYDLTNIQSDLSPRLTLRHPNYEMHPAYGISNIVGHVTIFPKSEYILSYDGTYIHIFSMSDGTIVQTYIQNARTMFFLLRDNCAKNTIGKLVSETPDNKDSTGFDNLNLWCFLGPKFNYRDRIGFILSYHNINCKNTEVLAFVHRTNPDHALILHDYAARPPEIPTTIVKPVPRAKRSKCVIS